MYKIIIPGQPQGKARARTFNNNGITRTVTPEKTVIYENLIKMQWIMVHLPMLQGMLHMEITAYYQIPKSKSNKVKNAMACGEIRPTTKPDIDNVIKCIADGLNKTAYDDDTQIVSLTANKWYSHEPRVEVVIREIEKS